MGRYGFNPGLDKTGRRRFGTDYHHILRLIDGAILVLDDLEVTLGRRNTQRIRSVIVRGHRIVVGKSVLRCGVLIRVYQSCIGAQPEMNAFDRHCGVLLIIIIHVELDQRPFIRLVAFSIGDGNHVVKAHIGRTVNPVSFKIISCHRIERRLFCHIVPHQGHETIPGCGPDGRHFGCACEIVVFRIRCLCPIRVVQEINQIGSADKNHREPLGFSHRHREIARSVKQFDVLVSQRIIEKTRAIFLPYGFIVIERNGRPFINPETRQTEQIGLMNVGLIEVGFTRGRDAIAFTRIERIGFAVLPHIIILE